MQRREIAAPETWRVRMVNNTEEIITVRQFEFTSDEPDAVPHVTFDADWEPPGGGLYGVLNEDAEHAVSQCASEVAKRRGTLVREILRPGAPSLDLELAAARAVVEAARSVPALAQAVAEYDRVSRRR